MDAGANSAEDHAIDDEHGEQSVNARERQKTIATIAGMRT
jgi:hypothetical protein